VTLSNRIAAALDRRSVLLAFCALPCAALLIVDLVSRHHWHSEAAALRRENLGLEIKQLSSAIDRQSNELEAGVRALAATEGFADWVQESSKDGARESGRPSGRELAKDSAKDPQTPPRFDVKGAEQRGINGFFVATPTQLVRYGGVIVDDRLVDRAPEPGAVKYLDSVIAAASVANGDAEARVGFADDEFIAAEPIMVRGSSVPAGWVAATRRLSPALLARLREAASGSLTGNPIRQVDTAQLPPDVRSWLASHLGDSFGLSTTVSADLSGYVVLRDAWGAAAWVFRLDPGAAPAVTGAPAAPSKGVLGQSFETFLALLGVLVGAAVILALRHYFRHRQTVDSRYKALIDQTNDGIVIVGADGYRIQYCNPALLNKLGYTSAEAAELALTDIFADGDASPDGVLARLQNADAQSALNLQLRCKSGAQIDAEVRCNRLETDGREGFAYVTHDVSVRRKAEQQLIDNQQRLDRMAHHDQLTGLPNRHYLATFLPEAINEARAANQMLGVVFLDLDRFKHINDTRGHETGDKLLQEVARRLKACVRDSDVVIRMGGDEFVVVFRNVKSYDEVTHGAKRINDCLNKSIVIDQHPLQTTGSVGVSLFPRDGADMGELLKHSDTAMYQAKDRGRNNVQMFSQIMNRKLKLRVAMEASLRDALRLKQLDVHYQPFVNLLTRKVVGLEALIRWRHPVHGMIPADQFIPIAEETGLIVPMGNFVLHRTFQTMSAWQRQGVKLVPVSLNVAPAQLQRGDLQATISTLLATHGLRADLLQLEMTERAVFDASQAKSGENRQDTMVRLRDLGIKIAIDDFGTGYSSLSYLKNWRVDALKIDRSFVRDLVTDSSDLAIVSAIIAIARHLRIQVIAEGIEGYQQAEILRKLGCTIGQGFLFARPMPADQCLPLLGNNAQGAGEEEDMLAAFASGRA
jgi:diguanylate cyclase (GGDEF)-like protein/PAS domain S-box-containing protein